MNNCKTSKHKLWTRCKAALSSGETTPASKAPSATMPEQEHGTPLADSFSNLVLASLLLELPEHRQAITAAWQAGDMQALADCAHKLSGAVAYCDLPELESALAMLRHAINNNEVSSLGEYYTQATRRIDELLKQTGHCPQ